MKKSLHIIADFYKCKGNHAYLSNVRFLRNKLTNVVLDSGFGIIASHFHKFGGSRGITGIFIVIESHLMVHTWPEKKSVNVDIFFCNYNKDNSKKSKIVFKTLIDLYKPERIIKKEIKRGY